MTDTPTIRTPTTSRPPSPASRRSSRSRSAAASSSRRPRSTAGSTPSGTTGRSGVELKNNVKRAWWRAMVQEREDIVGLDAGILMHPQVWVTSGHVGSFSDPLVECGNMPPALPARRAAGRGRPVGHRADGPRGRGPARPRVPVRRGAPARRPAPVQPDVHRRTWARSRTTRRSSTSGRRPRRARTSTSRTSSRARARRSRSGSPRSGSRSGTRSARATSSSGCASSSRWRCSTSSGPATPRRRPSTNGCRSDGPGTSATASRPRGSASASTRADELAHYAKKAIDVEYRFPFGWKELEGVHNRGDFDLSSHAKASGENLEYFDQAADEHFIPWVVETAAGADRAAFTFLIDAYREEEVRGETRVVLGFHPDLAPYKVAVLPLLKKRPEIVEICHRLRADLATEMIAVYDDTAAIGKLYRRQDEIGTPWCITVDVEFARGRCGHDPGARRDDPGAGAARGREAADRRQAGGLPGVLTWRIAPRSWQSPSEPCWIGSTHCSQATASDRSRQGRRVR